MPFNVLWSEGGNEVTIKIGKTRVKESAEENLLGIIFNQSFSFKTHVNTLCRKAGQKLHTLYPCLFLN